MTITVLTQYYRPEMGAPQSRLYEMVSGLKDLKWNIIVVTTLPNYPTGSIFPSYRRKFIFTEQSEGTTIRRHWLFASNSARTFPRIVSMLSFSFTSLFSLPLIRRSRPDYIFVESPPLTLGVSGWILARLSGARLVLNVSDIWPLSARELGAIRSPVIYNILETLEHWLYRSSFIVTGQSDEIVSHVLKLKNDRVWLFRNGVDPSRFKVAKASDRKGKLVYFGLLGVAQGLLDLCKNVNFKSLGLELDLYGTGAQADDIIDFLKANPERGIRYCGILDRDEVPGILTNYEGALIPLVTHLYGAVPSKIYEALAAGLPILFSGTGEGARIVEQHRAGWISAPSDWEELIHILKRFSKLDEQELLALRIRNRETALKYFNRSEEIRRLSEYLGAAVNEKKQFRS